MTEINLIASGVVRPSAANQSPTSCDDVGVRGHHPSLNDWLFLKQHGLDADLDEVELVNKVDGLENIEAALQFEGPDAAAERKKKRAPLWQWVRDGKVDAAFLVAPGHLFAEDVGLKTIEIEPLPMIWYTTISSSLPFVEKHPDIVERFLKGLIEGVHFFKTQRERSIDIIRRRYTKEGQMNEAQAAYVWQTLAPLLEPKLYPHMTAISNVYEEAKREDADAARINPLALWDFHALRRLDDSGFADRLYASGADAPERRHAHDPVYRAEIKKRDDAIVDTVKACGHPQAEECGCE